MEKHPPVYQGLGRDNSRHLFCGSRDGDMSDSAEGVPAAKGAPSHARDSRWNEAYKKLTRVRTWTILKISFQMKKTKSLSPRRE